MTYDQHGNFAYAKVGLAPSAPTSGTTFSLLNADADLFPSPSTSPYNVVVWAANQNPLSSNSEIVRITAKGAHDSGGAGYTQFTVTRLAEQNIPGNMTARAIQAGDQISNAQSFKWWSDIEQNKLDIDGSMTMTGQLKTSAYAAGSVLYADGSKMAQDNSNLFYDSTNHVLAIGTNTPNANSPFASAGLEIDNTGGQHSDIVQRVAAGYGTHFFAQSNGTLASPTVTASGNGLGSFEFLGYTGSSYAIGAFIGVQAATSGTFGLGSMPTDIVIQNALRKQVNISNNSILISSQKKIALWSGSSVGNLSSNFDVMQPVANLPGTVTTNGTTTLTGTETSFTNDFKVGDTINVSGETARIIASISGDTSLTVTSAFSTSASSLTYSSSSRYILSVKGNGRIGINNNAPTAFLHLAAGTATAGTAPIKFITGTNLTTPEAGAVEYDGTTLYYTNSNGVRTNISYSPATKVIAPQASGYRADFYTTGSSDDTIIQACINAVSSAGGGIIYITEGTYTLSATLTLASNVYISGSGWNTILKMANSTNTTCMQNNPSVPISNAVVKDLAIDMNGANNTTMTSSKGVGLWTPTNCTIDRVYVHDIRHVQGQGNVAIGITNATNTIVKNNHVYNVGDYGIASNGLVQCKIIDNYIHNPAGHGMSMEGSSTSGFTRNYQVTISRNIVFYDSSETLTIQQGLKIGRLDYCVITDNTFYCTNQNGGRGITTAEDSGLSTDSNFQQNNTIDNNTIYGFSVGVEVRGSLGDIINANTITLPYIATSGAVGIFVRQGTEPSTLTNSQNYIITNNQINELTSTAATSGAGIELDNNQTAATVSNNKITNISGSGMVICVGVNNSTFTGNNVINSRKHGVILGNNGTTGSSYNIFSHNNFSGNSLDANATYSDINIPSGSNSIYNIFSNNNFQANGTNKTIYAINENDSTNDHNSYANNVAQGQTSGAINLKGVNSVINGYDNTYVPAFYISSFGSNGGNICFDQPGTSGAKKFIRSRAGKLQVIDSGYGNALMTIKDNGNVGLLNEADPQLLFVLPPSNSYGIDMAAPASPAAVLATGGSLTVSTTYFYKISAFDGVGESIGGTEVSATPTSGNQTINLSWTAVPGAVSYKVYRSTTSGSYGATSLLATATVTTQTDDGTITLTTGTPRGNYGAYAVKFNGIGNSWIVGGNVGIGTTTPSALLHVAAGTTTKAPVKLTSGTNVTTITGNVNDGALEYNGTHLFFTIGSTRYQIDQQITGTTVASLTGTANQVLVNGTSGSATTGAITLTLPQSIGTGSSPTFAGLTLTGFSGVLKASAGVLAGSAVLNDIGAATGDYSLNSHKITNLLDPANPQDAATKNYVDATAQGLSVKPSAIVATTTTLPAYSYASGVITMTSTGAVAIDGHTLALNDIVLVKNETSTNQPNNGLYTVTTAGAIGVALVLTRHTSMDASTEFSGAFVFVESGTVNVSAGFVCTTTGSVTVGTTNINFTQFSGAGEITAGTGLTKSGNTLSTVQDISTGASPVFAGLTTNGLTLNGQAIITSNAGSALVVGPNGTTTPTLNIDSSTTSSVTGLNIKAAAAGAGLAITVTSSAGQANENVTFDAKGSGTISLGSISTGNIIISTLQLTNALAVGYGGTGQTSYTDGQLLIGNTTGNTLAKATLTAGNNVTVTNGHGSIMLDTIQNIRTTDSPTFVGLTLSGNVGLTIANSANVDALTITQNDTTNNKKALNITSTITGGNENVFTGANISNMNFSNIAGYTSDAGAKDKGFSIQLGGYDDAAKTTLINFGGIVGRKENSTDVNTRGYLALLSNQNERIRLDSNGRIGIGGAPPVGTTYVNDLTMVASAAKTWGLERTGTASTAGVNLTIAAQAPVSGGTNLVGGKLLLSAGLGTGNSVPGYVSLQASPLAAASGTGDNAVVDRQITGATKVLTNNSAINLVNFTIASNTIIAAIVRYSIEVFNGTDLQLEEGEILVQCANKGGVFSGNTVTQLANDGTTLGKPKQILTAGTLGTSAACVWAITGANPAVLSVNANSSLTPSTGYPRITYTIENLTQQAIAIQ